MRDFIFKVLQFSLNSKRKNLSNTWADDSIFYNFAHKSLEN